MIHLITFKFFCLLALHSKRVVLPDGIKEAVVLVADGVILNVVNTMPSLINCEWIELGNKILMPGIIDPHVHINEPGRTGWEGFDTATKAALAMNLMAYPPLW